MKIDGPSRFRSIESFIEQVADQHLAEKVSSVLGNIRRQFVVLYLFGVETDEWISVGEIARWIGGQEEGIPPEAVAGQAYKRVRTALTQGHLDALASAGIIRYNDDRQQVSRGPKFNSTGRYLLILLLVIESESD